MNPQKVDIELLNPPGEGMLRVIHGNGLLGDLAHHIGHIPQIIEDHMAMWYEASTDDQKKEVHARFRRQVARILISVGGFEIFLHGLIYASTGYLFMGGSLLIVGSLVMRLTRGG